MDVRRVWEQRCDEEARDEAGCGGPMVMMVMRPCGSALLQVDGGDM